MIILLGISPVWIVPENLMEMHLLMHVKIVWEILPIIQLVFLIVKVLLGLVFMIIVELVMMIL
jgi:hypothetical protein